MAADLVDHEEERGGGHLSGRRAEHYRQKRGAGCLRARLAGPLTDSLRGSITAVSSKFDGYALNVFNNTVMQGYDRQGVRGMLEYDVSDTIEVLFIAETYSADNAAEDMAAHLAASFGPDLQAAELASCSVSQLLTVTF